MANRRRRPVEDRMTEDEELTVAEVVGAFETIGEFIDDEENELPSIDQLGCEARLKLLNGIWRVLGDSKVEHLKYLLADAADGEMRSPK